MTRPTVTVYTRRSCKLCEMVEVVVRQVATGRADVEFLDVDEDASLYERYTLRVPVVAVDGEEIAEYHLDPSDLRAALDARTATDRRARPVAKRSRWSGRWRR